jgi:S-adenosylmethionine decarboxylase proenzyme, Bacillus form
MTTDDRALTGFGLEYIVDVYGCDPDLLRSCERLNTIVTRLIREVGVRPVRGPLWQMFPEPGGITGLWLLAESHLAVHTYPETCFAALNLYSCGSARPYAWENRLRAWFEADHVDVRTLDRGARHPSHRNAPGSEPVEDC